MDIRSGRFKGSALGGISIIAAKASVDAVYRIFNSGDPNVDPAAPPAFEVHAGSAAVAVEPGSSVDILVPKTKNVTIVRSDAVPVVGSYEFLDRPSPFRSGRFKGKAAANEIPIIVGRNSKLYRIFNSGDASFTVDTGNSTTDLDPTHSIDVVVGNNVLIKGAGAVEGIYEYLEAEYAVRSGRFKIDAAPSAAHKIIHLSAPAPEAYYRIFNSGDNEFKVQQGSTDLGTLKPEQSFDFTVSQNQQIFVVAAGSYPIEGIYDLLALGK
ncbi:MAG: hypothetical protein ACYC6Y_15025 [Thermoguttaceae bacterium]